MTNQQKARAHLTRAQELLKEQYKDNLGFGTETIKVRRGDNKGTHVNDAAEGPIRLLPRDELSMVIKKLDDTSLENASMVDTRFNVLAKDELLKRLQVLRTLATDDQNLINAIQGGHDDMAHKLLKHRTGSPKIDEAAIQNGHHVHVIQQVLRGALESNREIKLKLPVFDANDATPFNVTINAPNENGSFSAVSNEDSTRELHGRQVLQPYIPKGKHLNISIERSGSDMMYDLRLRHLSSDGHFRYVGLFTVDGVLDLGAKNTDRHSHLVLS